MGIKEPTHFIQVDGNGVKFNAVDIVCEGAAQPLGAILARNDFQLSKSSIRNCAKGVTVSPSLNGGSLTNNNFENVPTAVENLGSGQVSATHNYWGTTDAEAIGNMIRDFYDDILLGKVDISGWLEFPVADAGPDFGSLPDVVRSEIPPCMSEEIALTECRQVRGAWAWTCDDLKLQKWKCSSGTFFSSSANRCIAEKMDSCTRESSD